MGKSKVIYSAVLTFLSCNCLAQEPASSICINQSGYYPRAPKIAVIKDAGATNRFCIVSSSSKDTVYKGNLTVERQSAYSSAKTRIADFTQFQKPGTYLIFVPGVGRSYDFQIKANVHRTIAIATLKGFYYQRSGMALDKKYAGKWARKEGHPDTLVFVHPSAAGQGRPAGTVISCSRGWYDAGDYNKYIVNSGITMGTLLSAYEDFPDFFTSLKTNIPESNNGIPDILNESLYNLRWMLTMQDPFDGGVYHKCTNAAFDAMIMPDAAIKPRYVVQKGTAATLDFAAVMAQASRIVKQFGRLLPGLHDSCLKAAKKAWDWALTNPAIQYDQNESNRKFDPDITTGAYGDRNFNDEWMWAASELWITTKSKVYYTVLTQRKNDPVSLPSWNNVTMLAYYSLIRLQKELPAEAKPIIHSMKDSIISIADQYISKVPSNAFGAVMGQSKRDFIWGSNAVAANQGALLINAFRITGDSKYLFGALSNLDYLLGRNATGYCFVTGAGTKSTMHPHHRPSVADGIEKPVPGLLAGGPNPGQQDKCHYEFSDPETSYSDSDCAYASNEIAINWNAPMVYLVNALEALQSFLSPKK